MMLEIHATTANTNSPTSFNTRWIDGCFERESIVEDGCTVHLDRYTTVNESAASYKIHDELIIVVDGEIHDMLPAAEQHLSLAEQDNDIFDIFAAAYQTYGWNFPHYLIGDYRFLLFNRATSQLLVGRDKTTYDPVYIAPDETAVAMSTDMAALASEINATVNGSYLGHYLTGAIEPEKQTFYSEIDRIPPGCVGIVSGESVDIRRYYHPHTDERHGYRRMSADELGTILRQKLAAAIACRVSPGEEIGVFMSGGADSTAITGLAADHDASLKSYSYTFPNTTKINETEGIEAAIGTYGIQNERISLDDYWVLKDKSLYEQAWSIAPPVDPFLQPKDELLRRAASDGKRIVLTGDKGNMFDGHRLSIADALRAGAFADAIKTAWNDSGYTTAAALVRYGIAPLLQLGSTHELPTTRVKDPIRSRLTPALRREIEKERRSRPRSHQAVEDFCDQLTYRILTSPTFDYRFDIFRKRAKAHGIRAIDPYQDSRLVEFVFNLPPTYSLKGGKRKAIFRIALQEILPEYILSRQKTDRVEEEAAEGLRREQPYVASLLGHQYLKAYGIIQDQFYPDSESLIDHFGDTDTGPTHLWEYLSAQTWMKTI